MTIPPESTDELVAFLDANIVLEGKPVAELPWTEIATAGLIRVLIVPKVMDEIDAKKRDGRLFPHAMAFNLVSEKPAEGHFAFFRSQSYCLRIAPARYSRDELDSDRPYH